MEPAPENPLESIENEDAGDQSQAQAPEQESELELAVRERGEYLESFQRARADYKNLRRRLQEDIDLAVAKERTLMLSELLLVLDFLDMALRAECTTDEGKNLKVGVEMTRGQLLQMLEKQDVGLVPEGGLFDPAIHQAVESVEASGHAPGEVVETVRPGYRIGEQILRHAHVKVAADQVQTKDDAASAEGGDRGQR